MSHSCQVLAKSKILNQGTYVIVSVILVISACELGIPWVNVIVDVENKIKKRELILGVNDLGIVAVGEPEFGLKTLEKTILIILY